MQLIYGNDGINYRTIDKSPEMSEGVEKAILGTYSKYEFVLNPRAYSNEPEAVTYVTSNLDRQLPEDQLLVCKAGHMRNFSSPSYYLHCLVRKVPDDFYKEQFFEIFNYRFVSDYDINQYGGGSIENYRFSGDTGNTVSLTNEQLVVILASFMSNENRGQKTKILVDAAGDAYNARSREILASIYRYLPPELRRAYGFKSYCQDGKNLPARVSFVLFNRDEAKDCSGCISLDQTRDNIRNSVEGKYLEYAEYLVEGLDSQGRLSHFETLEKLAKNGWLAIEDCVLFYTKLKSWESGTQEELLPDWIQYVDQNSFLKGALYERLLEIIASKVDNEYYNAYLFEKVLELYNESIYHLSPMAAKTIRFADCLDNISIDSGRFHKWYVRQMKVKIDAVTKEGKATALESRPVFSHEIDLLKSVDIMSQELTKLLKTEIESLTKLVQQCDENLAEAQENELEKMGREIAKLNKVTFDKFCEHVEMIWNDVQFPENRSTLILNIEEWVDEHIQRTFISEKELTEYEQRFEGLKEKLSPEKYNYCKAAFTAERQRLEEERKARFFMIADGKVLETYRNLIIYQEKGVLGTGEELEVKIGNQSVTMKAEELKSTLEFILQPDKGNGTGLRIRMMILTETHVFTAEHLQYLLNADLEEEQIEEVIDYYLMDDNVPVKISGTYVGKLIKKHHGDMAKSLKKAYEDQESGEFVLFCKELAFKKTEGSKKRNEDWDEFGDEEDDSPTSKPKPEKKGRFGLFGRKG